MYVRRASPALLVALALLACGSSDPPSTPVSLKVPVGGSPQRGPSDAWVTVVEFGDFECPYCRAEEPLVERVSAAWPNDVRLVWKHVPLGVHAHAHDAAIAAECAHLQGKFWEMHDLLLTTALDAPTLLQDASSVPGLDVAAWQACVALTTSQATSAVDADVAFVEQLRVGGTPIVGTPTFVINGVVLVGAVPEEDLRGAILQARAAAIASGIARANYYDTVVLGRSE